jgi:hypothetical protein
MKHRKAGANYLARERGAHRIRVADDPGSTRTNHLSRELSARVPVAPPVTRVKFDRLELTRYNADSAA